MKLIATSKVAEKYGSIIDYKDQLIEKYPQLVDMPNSDILIDYYKKEYIADINKFISENDQKVEATILLDQLDGSGIFTSKHLLVSELFKLYLDIDNNDFSLYQDEDAYILETCSKSQNFTGRIVFRKVVD